MHRNAEKKMSAKQQRLFAQCYVDTREQLYWYILRKVSKKELAEDFTADLYVKLAKHPDILEDRDVNGVKAWLYTVARNMVIDYYRKVGSAPAAIDVEDEVFDIIAKDDVNYLDDVIRDEEIGMLLESLESLNAVEKEVITLRFKDDLKFNEIADILGKKEGAVKMLLYRAIEKLRENMNL